MQPSLRRRSCSVASVNDPLNHALQPHVTSKAYRQPLVARPSSGAAPGGAAHPESRSPMHVALLLLALQQPAVDSALRGVRDPAFAPDGRLVVSIDGDLYLQAAGSGAWSRLTTGPAWDREPVWARDGASIVFSSDRSGGFDLWRLP